MDGEPVGLDAVVVLDGPVEDLLAGVVADGAGCRGLHADAQIALVGAEHHAVEVVDRHPVEATGRR